jgi:glutathione S-transferase
MPKLKLSYFDFDGGRGEPRRLALSIANIPFEDHRFPVSDWPNQRESTPLLQSPVFEIDGEVITQSSSISRYAGRLSGLYPDDALQALYCDEVFDLVEDIVTKIVKTFFMEEDEKREAREALAAGPMPLYLKRLQTMLETRGGRYFADDRLTIADFKVFLWVRNIKSGLLDYMPTDLVDREAPKLNEHFDRISNDPGVVAYYESRKSS